MKSIDTFNSKNHRYIIAVREDEGWLVIYGRIGRRNYMGYNLKDAVARYNKECKKRLDR